jgi:hypothetical protein
VLASADQQIKSPEITFLRPVADYGRNNRDVTKYVNIFSLGRKN